MNISWLGVRRRVRRVPALRIDLLSGLDGVDFSSSYERRITYELDALQLPFISLSDLKANKLASGRHKDLADLENL